VGGEEGADPGGGMAVKPGAGEAPLGVEHGLIERDRQHQSVERLRGRAGDVEVADLGETDPVRASSAPGAPAPNASARLPASAERSRADRLGGAGRVLSGTVGTCRGSTAVMRQAAGA
jgi:hypothetical protein